jgi:hypothetical protein
MAVSANRKAQAGFVYTRESTAPYTGIPNLLQKVNIMQNNIPAQTAQETVTIPLELANRIMDALYYGGEFIANTGAIIDTICDNMAAQRIQNAVIRPDGDTARLATVIQTLVPHAENLESFDLSSELAGYIQN